MLKWSSCLRAMINGSMGDITDNETKPLRWKQSGLIWLDVIDSIK